VSFPIRDGDRELFRVEVLEARADGTAKFRLWYYKWRETRPDRPYVDVEIKSYPRKDGVGFIGRVSANEAEGIRKEHLAEIADLLKREGVKGVSLISDGEVLYFTGAFRDSVLRKLGIRPELPPGKPPSVQHLGGYKFRVGDKEVEFGRGYVKGGYEFYSELKFPSREEAERFASSLKAIGVDAKIIGSEKAGYAVKLGSDSFFGLLAAADATPSVSHCCTARRRATSAYTPAPKRGECASTSLSSTGACGEWQRGSLWRSGSSSSEQSETSLKPLKTRWRERLRSWATGRRWRSRRRIGTRRQHQGLLLPPTRPTPCAVFGARRR